MQRLGNAADLALRGESNNWTPQILSVGRRTQHKHVHSSPRLRTVWPHSVVSISSPTGEYGLPRAVLMTAEDEDIVVRKSTLRMQERGSLGVCPRPTTRGIDNR